MKVLILGGSNSRNSGGVFDTARTMGLTLNQRDKVDVEYLMFDDEYSAEDKPRYYPLPVHTYTVKGPRKIGFSTDLYDKMKDIRPDIVHTQSLWMYLSCVNKKYHRQTGTPYVISPHGMLDHWQLRQSFWKDLKKSIVLRLYEKKHLQETNCFHALCREEHDAIRSLGFKNPIAIIPNGIALPDLQRNSFETSLPANGNTARRTLLFLGRIHPKKGLDNLLEAWALTEPGYHNWQLVIAGETKDHAYLEHLIARTHELRINDTATFAGGLYGKKKQDCLVNSHAFILPSFSEGLPMSVLEAWSYHLPALITSHCNLPEGFQQGAALQIGTDVENIAGGIRRLLAMTPGERSQMGAQGYELAKRKFTWTKVSDSMTQLYNWILNKGDRPSFVYSC